MDFIPLVLVSLVNLLLGGLIGYAICRRRMNRPVPELPLAEAAPAAKQDEISPDLVRAIEDMAQRIVSDSNLARIHRDASHHAGQVSQRPGNNADVLAGRIIAQVISANEDLQGKLARSEEQLDQQSAVLKSQMAEARTDPLTGLPNRRAFDNELARRFAEWQRTKIPFSVIVVDVDHFKQVNDRYGHVTGDEILRSVATVLKDATRAMDLVARYGGEEFVAILPSCNLENAGRVGERFRKSLQRHVTTTDFGSLSVTASVGLAQVMQDVSGVDLVERADTALYSAKSGGRNQTHSHDGTQCVPVQPDTAGSPPVSPENSHLNAACDELQIRIKEMLR